MKLSYVVKVQSRGRIQIPQEILRSSGIDKNSKVYVQLAYSDTSDPFIIIMKRTVKDEAFEKQGGS